MERHAPFTRLEVTPLIFEPLGQANRMCAKHQCFYSQKLQFTDDSANETVRRMGDENMDLKLPRLM